MSKRAALGPAIKSIRLAKGITASTVAQAAGMSDCHLFNIEAKRRPATEESIPLIATALGVEVDAISIATDDRWLLKALA